MRCSGARLIRRLGLTAVLVTVAALDQVQTMRPVPAAADALEAFLAHHRAAHQYSASRRLEASGSGRSGWLVVQTDFTRTSGLRYEVTNEGGSGYIRRRVLRSLLDEEQRVLAQSGGAGATISRTNYRFTPEGVSEEGLAVIALEPRRKDRSLLAGRMLLTPDGDLVRLEGRLAKNPSFWVNRVQVVRSFQRINGVVMPVSLDTTAELKLLGSSALRMTYRYSAVDDRPVNHP